MTLLDAAVAQGKALSDLKVSLEKLAAHNAQIVDELAKVQADGQKPCGHPDYFCGCPGSEWDETDSDRTGDDYDKDYSNQD